MRTTRHTRHVVVLHTPRPLKYRALIGPSGDRAVHAGDECRNKRPEARGARGVNQHLCLPPRNNNIIAFLSTAMQTRRSANHASPIREPQVPRRKKKRENILLIYPTHPLQELASQVPHPAAR